MTWLTNPESGRAHAVDLDAMLTACKIRLRHSHLNEWHAQRPGELRCNVCKKKLRL